MRQRPKRKLLSEKRKDQMVKLGRKTLQVYDALFPDTADRIWAYRQTLGLTQRDFAEECGLSASVIGSLERGYTLGLGKTLFALAKGTHISVDYVLGLSSKQEISR